MSLAHKDLYLKMGRPRNSCVACGAAITHVGKHPSVLRHGGGEAAEGVEDPDAPRRDDYCVKCWQDLAERDFVGFWVTRREPPKPRKIETRKERNAALLAWFELLHGNEDVNSRQTVFFLAHLLMKYGVFKWQRTETDVDGVEKVVFRQVGSDDEVEVISVEFSDERSVEIKRELDEFLDQYANSQPEEEAVGPDAAGEGDRDE